MSLQPTRTTELPEIGAVHVLAVDIFIAVQDAYYPRTGHRIGLWQELSTAQKCAYIAAAKTLLESYRPPTLLPIKASLSPPSVAGSGAAVVTVGPERGDSGASVLAFPQPQDEPPRCVYCGDPAPTGDYCSLICEIDAQNEGA